MVMPSASITGQSSGETDSRQPSASVQSVLQGTLIDQYQQEGGHRKQDAEGGACFPAESYRKC